jgi:uncharacterized membrane protein YdjX (TVP38/TMEM64 family)
VSSNTSQSKQDAAFEPPVSNLPKSVKIIALVFWLSLVVGFWLYARQQDTSLVVQLANVIDALQQGWLGPLVLFLVYMVRPFVLAPVTFLTLLAGFLYGAVGGYTLAMVALLASAMVVYGVGMLSSRSAYGLSQRPMIAKLRDNSFETVLISRLLFIPGDITNYLCGLLRVDIKAFLWASLIGGTPGALMVVLVGASIEGDFETRSLSLRPSYLIVSALLLVSSLGLSQYLRRRNRDLEPPVNAE